MGQGSRPGLGRLEGQKHQEPSGAPEHLALDGWIYAGIVWREEESPRTLRTRIIWSDGNKDKRDPI